MPAADGEAEAEQETDLTATVRNGNTKLPFLEEIGNSFENVTKKKEKCNFFLFFNNCSPDTDNNNKKRK